MKTVASFSLAEEAYMLRAHLEGSGIPAFVRDDNTVSTDWLLSIAVGGVKVDVPDEFFEQASQLYHDFQFEERQRVKAENASKPQFARYVKIALAAFLATFIGILVYGGSFAGQALAAALIPAALVGGGVAAVCGILDI